MVSAQLNTYAQNSCKILVAADDAEKLTRLHGEMRHSFRNQSVVYVAGDGHGSKYRIMECASGCGGQSIAGWMFCQQCKRDQRRERKCDNCDGICEAPHVICVLCEADQARYQEEVNDCPCPYSHPASALCPYITFGSNVPSTGICMGDPSFCRCGKCMN